MMHFVNKNVIQLNGINEKLFSPFDLLLDVSVNSYDHVRNNI